MMLLSLQVALAGPTHPVRAGETIESISAEAGIDAAQVRSDNGIPAGQQPSVGTLLELPEPTDTHHGEQNAFLTTLTGKGTITAPDGTERPATTFDPMEAGSTVCTALGAHATLRLASTCDQDGTDVDDLVLDSETCVVVDSAFSTADGRASVVTVTQGTVAVQHVPDARGHITLRTESGTTTGSEGGYRVTVEEDSMRTESLYADVAVQGAGEEVALGAGQGNRVVEGEAPSAPVDLLVAGPLLRPEDAQPLRRPRFEWSAVEGAMGYRFEIAGDVGFSEVLFVETLEETSYEAEVIQLPVARVPALYWRVASFDRLGFVGIPTDPRTLGLPTGVGR